MGTEKGKKAKTVAAEDDNSSDHIDGDLVLSIEKLQEIQDELEKINEEASDKVLEVEQKYNVIRKPIYDKRNEIIKDIPDFWQTAFLSHPALFHLLTEDDQKVFKYLQSLDVTDFKDVKSGYSITFSFSPNPYFENAKLTKTVAFDDDGNVKFTGTSIKWKEGMNISNGVVHKKKGKKRPLVEESFFTFFGEDESLSDVNVHDEVADMIKEDLWTNPLKYFNSEADEDDDDDDDDDDEENGIMEEDGSSEDDSEEDGEDEDDDS